MFFSESSNLVHLEFGNVTYHLNIKTKCQDADGNQTESIYLHITIVKMMGHNKYQAETLELIYTLKTRAYSTFNKVQGFASLLYGRIVELLDEAYGDTW